MPLPTGRARAFEAAGKQGFVWGWQAGNKGLISSADRAHMKTPVPRTTPNYGTKCPRRIATLTKKQTRFLLKIEMGGKPF